MNCCEIRSIGGGMVAENISVCRFLGSSCEDAVDLRHEPHVEHVVRLVEDQEVEVGEPRGALLDVVEQAAGGRHDDVGAAAQPGVLGPHLDAADQADRPQAEVAAEGVEESLGLERDLAGGRDDQGAGLGVVGEPFGDRQGEGRGLAGAGLGEADQVSPAERRRDDGGLDGGRMFEPDEPHAAEDRLTESQRVEIFLRGFNWMLWNGQTLHDSCL